MFELNINNALKYYVYVLPAYIYMSPPPGFFSKCAAKTLNIISVA